MEWLIPHNVDEDAAKTSAAQRARRGKDVVKSRSGAVISRRGSALGFLRGIFAKLMGRDGSGIAQDSAESPSQDKR